MKYTVAATVAALAITVSAQSPPACAVGCLTSAPLDNCGALTNTTCLCTDSSFITFASTCLCEKCTDPSDLTSAENLAKSFCAAVSGNLLPATLDCSSSSTAAVAAPTTAAESSTTEESSAAATTSTSSVEVTTTSSVAVVVTTTPSVSTSAASNSTMTSSHASASTSVPAPSPQPSNGAGNLAASGALALFGVVAALVL